MIRFFISMLHPFRKLFLRSGIDYEPMTVIIRTKLRIDDRMSKNINNTGDKNISNALLKQGFSMAIVGLFSFIFPYLHGNLETAFFCFHTMILIMFVLSFLSEYSQSLFDERDSHILLRLPVNSQTISAAKLIIIGYYMFFLAICALFIPTLVLLFSAPLYTVLLFIVATFLNTIFALLLTNIVYMSSMRFANGEKFQKILSYLQIALIVIVVGGYQVVINKAADLVIDLPALSSAWYFLPPVWFTALCQLPGNTALLLPSLLGILFPLFSVYATFKWFAPYFLNRLNDTIGEAAFTETVYRKEKAARFLTSVVTRHPLQKTAFILTWRLTSGNTKFKEAILPGIAYTIVMIGFATFTSLKNIQTESVFKICMPVYLTMFAAFLICSGMTYNSFGNLLWTYRVRPIEHPGQLLLGAFKAVYLKYYTPLFLTIAGILLCFTGIRAWADLLFIYAVITLTTLTGFLFHNPVFPFSMEKSTLESGNILLKSILTLFLCGIFVLFHFILTLISGGIIAGFTILCLLILFTTYKIKNISWKKIEKNYP